MAKLRDFTDYRMAIYGAKEHTTTDIHMRFLPKKKNNEKLTRGTPTILNYDAPILLNLPRNAEITAIKYNEFKYLFESQRDRAYLTRKAAWTKWETKHPILSLKEIFRTKKIGYLIYQEPASKSCDNDCGKCKATNDPRWKEYPYCYTKVEAFHHSLIRLPSGRLRTEPMEYVIEDRVKRLSDPEIITPYELEVKITNRLYRLQRGTVKYGVQKLFHMGWKVYLIIGLVVLGFIMYYLHLIPGM